MTEARALERQSSCAPDGGWGWAVVLASFVLQALTIGSTYTFGVLFVELLDVFKAGEARTSWIGSIQPFLLYLTGLLAGPALKRFGWRPVAMIGSVVSATGLLLSSFAGNVYTLYLTYGVLTGLGNGMMYVTSMVCVQHYFDSRRAMATGLAVSGSGVGTLIFGLLIQKLLDLYGWQRTLRIESGIMLIGIFFAAVYRPLPKVSANESRDGNSCVGRETDALIKEMSSSERTDDGYEYEDLDEIDCGDELTMSQSYFAVIRNPVFLLVALAIMMFCFGYHVPYTYTPERAQHLGVGRSDAASLVSVMGLANVASRLLFGWVGDKSSEVRFFLGGFVLCGGGLISVVVSFFVTQRSLVAYAVLFGMFSGCWASLFPVILVDLLGVDLIEQSLGMAMAAGSLAFLVATPMSGWIISLTGSFDRPFQVVGVAQTFGALAYFCLLFVRRTAPPKPQRPEALDASEVRGRRRPRRQYLSESFA